MDFLDFMGIISACLIIILQVVNESRTNRKGSYWFAIAIAILAVVMMFGQCNQIKKADAVEKASIGRDSSNIRKLDSLSNKADSLIELRRKDSIRDAEFEQLLRKEFEIIRDSSTNRPIQKNINIGTAREVNIY